MVGSGFGLSKVVFGSWRGSSEGARILEDQPWLLLETASVMKDRLTRVNIRGQ